MWLYIAFCPIVVSIMLMVEVWYIDTQQGAQARTR